MRVLFITGRQRTGAWLAEAFANDSAVEILLTVARGAADGLARLRDEVFDTVLIGHSPGELDALELLDAIRTGSTECQPIIVLGEQSEQEMSALCFEAGADVYLCVNTTTTRTLIWQVSRAAEHQRLISENHRLRLDQHQRLQREHDEASRLLEQQRALLVDLETIADGADERPTRIHGTTPPGDGPLIDLPKPLVTHYRELLRAYVVMGSGNLSDELEQLAQSLVAAHISAHRAMLLHLAVLEEMVRDLGNRSARHVMNRADLLVLEVIIKLAEGYRRRYDDQVHPPRQLLLPDFEGHPARALGDGATC
jgi:DNA-binding NarL/FixJ family response regulator